MKTTRTCSLVLALVLNVLGASAFAFDQKIMPGSACVSSLGYQVAGFYTYANTGMRNSNTTNATLLCPVVRDRGSNIDGTQFAYVYVQSSGSATLQCTLGSYSTTGGVIATNTASTTSNTPTALYLDVNASQFAGFYTISCYLPPGGTVISYRVGEFEPTDGE